jgi:hypothetical protein
MVVWEGRARSEELHHEESKGGEGWRRRMEEKDGGEG